MPMIPLGLKETKEIDFREPFKDFILEHYSEDANQYENAIADFMDTRQVRIDIFIENVCVYLHIQRYYRMPPKTTISDFYNVLYTSK